MMMQVGLRLERLGSGPRGSSDAQPWVPTPLVQAGPFVEFWDKAIVTSMRSRGANQCRGLWWRAVITMVMTVFEGQGLAVPAIGSFHLGTRPSLQRHV